ncbi:MAG: C1 family peptidase [Bacteroidota bacterium]
MASLKLTDLRTFLKNNKISWSIPDSFKISSLVTYHLGGDPAHLLPATKAPKLDLKKIIDGKTGNPYLLERRKALGFVKKAPLKVKKGDPPETLNIKPGFLNEVILPKLSVSVDWRNRWGTNWITKPKDQGGCESCWVFSAVGVVESMVRIEHCVWSKRSEGDVHDGLGAVCGTTGDPSRAFTWMESNGVADPACYPYSTSGTPYHPTADRNGRTVKIPVHTTFGNTNDQKIWLDTVGPITLCFDVWTDFDVYWNAGANGVYRKTNAPNVTLRGSHCVVAVGYDNTQSCWICKNSWGNGGAAGYFKIGYGQVNCDYYSKYGVKITNPDPWTKRRLHNGNIIESGNGAMHRNFEILASFGSSMKHWWRDGSSLGWGAGPVMANDVMTCPTLTSTTYNRNFECVYMTTTRRLHHWYYNQATNNWNDGGVFGPIDTWGVPGFIQGSYNAPGNFEVVVRTTDGRLNHWWRDGGGWHDGGRFGAGISLSGATLVQTQYGVNGNLELVAVNTAGQMQHFWRDDDHGFVWHAGVTFGSAIYSVPVMIEGQYGAGNEDAIGNYELCVAVGGAVQHWWRDNAGGTGWHNSATFGSNVRTVAGLVEGSYGFDLEVIVITNNSQLQHYWRDGAGWHAGPIFGNV